MPLSYLISETEEVPEAPVVRTACLQVLSDSNLSDSCHRIHR